MVTYEWDFESWDYDENGDVIDIDHDHRDNLDGCTLEHIGPYEGGEIKLVLVRNVGNENDGLTDRTWAYVVDGKLPTHFANAYDRPQTKIPQRFHHELAKRYAVTSK